MFKLKSSDESDVNEAKLKKKRVSREGRALTMVGFVGKSHLNGHISFYGLILVSHLPEKSDIFMKVR